MHRKRTHYEILGLKETCSLEEIRQSFVAMSKQYHPDKNTQDPGLHAKFVQINEAYSILRKEKLRRLYDFDIRRARVAETQRRYNYRTSGSTSSGDTMDTSNTNFSWRDESIWSMRDKSKNKAYPSDSYYGIKGVPRKPNSWIAAAACTLMGISALFHYFAIKHSRTFTESSLDAKSKLLLNQLNRVREIARENGNDRQLNILQEKTESARNGKPAQNFSKD